MEKSVKIGQIVQQWGNGLAVRITAPVARAAKLTRGQPITIEVVKQGVLIRSAGKPRLTLAQKLKAFDPKIHGGEAMISGRIGSEVF